MSPGVIGSSESVKPLPQSIFNHLFCFCQYSKTPSLPWDVNICQLAESPGHSSYCCWFFFLSTTSCVIYIDFYLTVSIFFQPKLPISISSPTNFCCKAIMETISKTKSIFTRDLCSSPRGLYAARIRKGRELQGTRFKQEIELILFLFLSQQRNTHASPLAGTFLWNFCNRLTTVLRQTYATVDWKLMAENKCVPRSDVLFRAEIGAEETCSAATARLFRWGCVCVLNMHCWFRHLLFGARVRGSDSGKEGGRRRRRRRRQPEDMERNRLWKERMI